MPNPKVVKSLQEICLDALAEIVENAKCCTMLPVEENVKPERCSPFDVLPSWMIMAIMDIIEAKRPRNLSCISLLLTKRLETLTFHYLLKEEEKTCIEILKTAALLHVPLKTLKLQSVKMIPHHVFQDCLSSFPYLLVLDVPHCGGINDDFLSLVSIYCKNLKALNLEFCHNVTDVGIRRLCVDSSNTSGEGSDVPGNCKDIVRLNIKGTKVTNDGAVLALKNLPFLKFFKCHSSLEAIAQMFQTEIGTPNPDSGARRLSLVNLLHTPLAGGSWILKSGMGAAVAAATQICPFVTHVEIHDFGGTVDKDLGELLNLEQLQELNLGYIRAVTFDGGILPLLKKFGPFSLEKLTLYCSIEFNIAAIIEHCPNLRYLRLMEVENCRSSSHQETQRAARPLHQLETLDIVGWETDSSQPTSADLCLLLRSSPALVRLHLDSLKHLDDQVLKRAFLEHGFSRLEDLNIRDCSRVTGASIDLLLTPDNPLKKIYLSGLQLGNWKSSWDSRARENNWDLSIDCYD